MALITDVDDRTLVERHRAGDPDAFHRIIVRHHRSLYSNALRRLGDPAAAEDAAQDAFIRAFRNLERFDGDYHLDAWRPRGSLSDAVWARTAAISAGEYTSTRFGLRLGGDSVAVGSLR